MNVHELLKQYAQEHDTTPKAIIIAAGLNYNNMINKFKRDTVYVSDLEKILDVLHKRLAIVDKQDHDTSHYD